MFKIISEDNNPLIIPMKDMKTYDIGYIINFTFDKSELIMKTSLCGVYGGMAISLENPEHVYDKDNNMLVQLLPKGTKITLEII
jgi:hypothetical protein